jgi:hypothetical protein
MTKKFVNLPQNYKKLLEDIKMLFNKNNLEELSNNNIKYKDLIKLYNKIEVLCTENSCNTYDLNRLINNYDKKNSITEILKRIATLRNKYIVLYAKESDLWNKNLIDIKNKYKKKYNKNITIENVEYAFVKILKTYKYDWDGLWAIINVDKSCNTKSISLFDLDDYENIFKILNELPKK